MLRKLVLLGCAVSFGVGAMFAAGVMGQGADRFVDVIVTLDVDHRANPPGLNRDIAARLARDHGVVPRRTYGTVFSGFAARLPEARLNALRQDPQVAGVTFDQTYYIEQSCNAPHTPPCEDEEDDDDGGGDDGDSEQEIPWGIERVGAIDNSTTGQGAHAYVLDTGIDAAHPDLEANLGNGFAATSCQDQTTGPPRNRRSCEADWDDDHGHGTHVAGTIGALDNDIGVVGVAPEVTLHAVKVCTGGGSCELSDILAGIDWAARETIERGEPSVINMSIGGSGSKSSTCDEGGFAAGDDDDAYHEALCNAAHDAGVVSVVAAGNDGADAENTRPAAYDDAVISVSATNENDDWPSWSNWGDAAADWTDNDSAPVGIAAPGVSVLSTSNDGGTDTKSGTSMASPHVAGAAALHLANATPDPDYQAFLDTRAALLDADEATGDFSNTSGNPHEEDFLQADHL